jgi:imidazolonepropionase-like amidohydrolase
VEDRVIEAAARTLRIVSTLDILSYGEVTPELRTAADNLARFRAADGRIVYGTDLGNGPIPPGIDVREALLLHEVVGMSPEEVLEAMAPGPLGQGSPADLVAFGRDPLEGLDALADVRLVVRAGRIVRRA